MANNSKLNDENGKYWPNVQVDVKKRANRISVLIKEINDILEEFGEMYEAKDEIALHGFFKLGGAIAEFTCGKLSTLNKGACEIGFRKDTHLSEVYELYTMICGMKGNNSTLNRLIDDAIESSFRTGASDEVTDLRGQLGGQVSTREDV